MFYKKILVPLDGSENAKLAARHAVALAKSGDMQVILLYCYGEIPTAIGGDARDTIIAECEKQGKSILEVAKLMCEKDGVSFKEVVAAGSPGRTIVSVAEKEHCDLIVMGSRGLSDFSGMVMGSVSHRVLRHAAMPVLVVR